MKTTSITVKGMHCGSCEALLTDVLGDVSGVKEAKVSLKDKARQEGVAVVTHDEAQASEHDLRKAIEAEGYKTA